METQSTSAPTADAAQLATLQKMLYLDGRIRGGIGWFFWIAALSIINTITYLSGITLTFVVGLGITQVVDGVSTALAKELGTGMGAMFVRLIGVIVNLLIAGLFVLFGVLGRKRHRIPVIIGMVLYALDAVLMLLFKDFFGAAFHAFALMGLWNGLKSMAELADLEKTWGGESLESLRKRLPAQQPAVTPQQRRFRWILMGLIAFVIFAATVIITLTQ